jgi:hypothetical protein
MPRRHGRRRRVCSRNANAEGLPDMAHAVERFDDNRRRNFTPGVIASSTEEAETFLRPGLTRRLTCGA